jgi:hypothetical protein
VSLTNTFALSLSPDGHHLAVAGYPSPDATTRLYEDATLVGAAGGADPIWLSDGQLMVGTWVNRGLSYFDKSHVTDAHGTLLYDSVNAGLVGLGPDLALGSDVQHQAVVFDVRAGTSFWTHGPATTFGAGKNWVVWVEKNRVHAQRWR